MQYDKVEKDCEKAYKCSKCKKNILRYVNLIIHKESNLDICSLCTILSYGEQIMAWSCLKVTTFHQLWGKIETCSSLSAWIFVFFL